MSTIFGDFDMTDFWNNSEYAKKEYVGGDVTPEQIAAVESELGYKLPAAYLALIRQQNGGMPKNTNHRTNQRTTWAGDHIAISGIYGIDRQKRCSLCGSFGSKFWIEEWEYPPIGVYICDCPSAGHDMVCLDYRKYGPNGEPEVVHVDQEIGYRITPVAENFEAFIRGLEADEAFE